MSRTPHHEQVFRVLRSVLLIVILTAGALFALGGDFSPPHGHPLLYAFAVSWLVAIGIAFTTNGIFRVNPKQFSLRRWERGGKVYDRTSVRAFRWVLLHSPLGWINGNFHVSARRTDCDRLLREVNAAEGVHWLSCLVATILGIWYLVNGYATYGYVMLLLRIPFDLFPIMLQRWNRGRVCRVLGRRPGAA
jgi:hypothetical protein